MCQLPAGGGQGERRPPPPHRVSCAAQVFIVSGVFGASSEVLRAGAWTLVAPLPAPVTGVRGAALANTVYMMGNCSSARSLTTAHCPQVASTATRTSTTTSGDTTRPPRPGRRPAPCSSPGASTQSASCRAGRSHSSVTDTDAGHSRGLVICSNKDENTDVMHLMLCVKYAVQSSNPHYPSLAALVHRLKPPPTKAPLLARCLDLL